MFHQLLLLYYFILFTDVLSLWNFILISFLSERLRLFGMLFWFHFSWNNPSNGTFIFIYFSLGIFHLLEPLLLFHSFHGCSVYLERYSHFILSWNISSNETFILISFFQGFSIVLDLSVYFILFRDVSCIRTFISYLIVSRDDPSISGFVFVSFFSRIFHLFEPLLFSAFSGTFGILFSFFLFRDVQPMWTYISISLFPACSIYLELRFNFILFSNVPLF